MNARGRAAVIVALVVGFVLGGGVMGWLVYGRRPEVARFTVAPAAAGTAAAGAVEEAVRRAGPVVVQVDTSYGAQGLPRALREMAPRDDGGFFPRGQGSGVVINGERGYIITNAHVVRNASRISVTLAGGERVAARVVGSEPFSDLALLQVKAPRLRSAVLGSSDDLPIGSWVVAIGNPFGLENSVTVGVLSAKRRDLSIPDRRFPLEDLIQTDAAINRGNSGGALVNLEGELIGIPTAIVAPRAGQGVGFAVPVERVKRVVPQLIEKGRAEWPWLGIEYAVASAEELKKARVPTAAAMVITSVTARAPADRAGLKKGDIVASADGRTLRLKADLQHYIRGLEPGARVALRVWRGGRWHSLRVVLQPIPQPPDER